MDWKKWTNNVTSKQSRDHSILMCDVWRYIAYTRDSKERISTAIATVIRSILCLSELFGCLQGRARCSHHDLLRHTCRLLEFLHISRTKHRVLLHIQRVHKFGADAALLAVIGGKQWDTATGRALTNWNLVTCSSSDNKSRHYMSQTERDIKFWEKLKVRDFFLDDSVLSVYISTVHSATYYTYLRARACGYKECQYGDKLCLCIINIIPSC
jgi:hypothetical protein